MSSFIAFRSVSLFLVAVGLALCVSPIIVEAKAKPTPVRSKVVRPTPSLNTMTRRITISGGHDYTSSDIAWMRKPQPEVPEREWLAISDPAVARWLAGDSGATASSQFQEYSLRIGIDGRAKNCDLQKDHYDTTPNQAVDFCPIFIRRARVLPGLNLEGQRQESDYVVTVELIVEPRHAANGTFSGPGSSAELPTAIAQGHYLPLPPAPPPPGSMGGPKSWPPTPEWLKNHTVEPDRIGSAEPAAIAPQFGTEPAVGLLVQAQGTSQVSCQIMHSSGNSGLDRDACSAAVSDFKPSWPVDTSIDRQLAAMTVIQDQKKLRAFVADRNTPYRPSMDEKEVLKIIALWQASNPGVAPKSLSVLVRVDRDGLPSNCFIRGSTGNDAADISACHQLLREARFQPARDVFGQYQSGEYSFQFAAPD